MSKFGDRQKRKWSPLKIHYYDEVIRLYFEHHYGYKRIAKILPVGRTTILGWVHEYLKIHPELKPEMKEKDRKGGEEERHDVGSATNSELQQIVVELRNQIDDLTRRLSDRAPSKVETLEKIVATQKRQLKTLEKELKDAELYNEIQSEMIKIAEARFGIEIRKKPGAK